MTTEIISCHTNGLESGISSENEIFFGVAKIFSKSLPQYYVMWLMTTYNGYGTKIGAIRLERGTKMNGPSRQLLCANGGHDFYRTLSAKFDFNYIVTIILIFITSSSAGICKYKLAILESDRSVAGKHSVLITSSS